jgi:multidrug resistance efflux pump
MTRKRRVLLVLGGLATVFLLYELAGRVIAYTDDAYVRSDLIAVAPQVTGRIIGVHVVDNQTVAKGDKLASIDPEPFQLAVAQRQAENRRGGGPARRRPGRHRVGARLRRERDIGSRARARLAAPVC